MTLLSEIQDAAIDASTDLATVLRKCRVLAARLKNADFTAWVQHELDGYPSDTEVPDYRRGRCQSQGHFSGPFGSGLRNAPIPPMCIPEEFRDSMETVEFRQGVTALKDLVEKSDGSSLHSAWPNDLVALISDRVYQRLNMMQAWRIVPVSAVVGILDTVRNRILNFVLEIESASPDTDNPTSTTPPLTAEAVGNVFNTYIMGNVGNIASGSSDFEQTAIVHIRPGNVSDLEDYMNSLGISAPDIESLKEAIKSEPKLTDKTRFGTRVAKWIGHMITQSAKGAWKISSDVAANLLSKALSAYYGID